MEELKALQSVKEAERKFRNATQNLIGDEFIVTDAFMEDLMVELDGLKESHEKADALEALMLRKGYEWNNGKSKYTKI